MRWVRIHLECYHVPHDPQAEPKDLFLTYRTSLSRYGKPDGYLPGIHTTAQFIAKHGGTDSRARCACLDDLLCCFDLCGSYNGFNAEKAKRAFLAFNKAHYHNANNPNNGKDAFQYHFAWEGSHAVYISVSTYYWEHGLRILSTDWRHNRELTRDQFTNSCVALGRWVKADESDATEDGWRLWWD